MKDIDFEMTNTGVNAGSNSAPNSGDLGAPLNLSRTGNGPSNNNHKSYPPSSSPSRASLASPVSNTSASSLNTLASTVANAGLPHDPAALQALLAIDPYWTAQQLNSAAASGGFGQAGTPFGGNNGGSGAGRIPSNLLAAAAASGQLSGFGPGSMDAFIAANAAAAAAAAGNLQDALSMYLPNSQEMKSPNNSAFSGQSAGGAKQSQYHSASPSASKGHSKQAMSNGQSSASTSPVGSAGQANPDGQVETIVTCQSKSQTLFLLFSDPNP